MNKNLLVIFTLICIALVALISRAGASAKTENPAGADASAIYLAQKPNLSFAEFKALWEREGKTPEGSVRCLLIAVLETVKEGNKDGKKMWGLVLPKDEVDGNGEAGPSIRFPISQFSRQVKGTSFRGGIAASYLGGTPQNGYQYSYSNKVVVDRAQSKSGEKKTKLFVRSGGKDMSSPVTLKKNKSGYWKIFEYSSLYTGVKPIVDDDF